MRKNIAALIDAPPVVRSWLVEGIIPTHSIVILAGDSGVGKSSLCYRMAMSVATGQQFIGRAVTQGRVLYLDEENNEQDSQLYLQKLWRGQPGDIDVLQAHMRFEHFSLVSSNETPYRLMGHLVTEHQPDLIFVDTYTTACQIEDPNSNGEANKALRLLRLVKAQCQSSCSMVLLHHTRVDAKTRSRDILGAKGLRHWTDATIFHKVRQGRPRDDGLRLTALEFEKMRGFSKLSSIGINPVQNTDGSVTLTQCFNGE